MAKSEAELRAEEAFASCSEAVHILRATFDGRVLAPTMLAHAMALYAILIQLGMTTWEQVAEMVQISKQAAIDDKREYAIAYTDGSEEIGILPQKGEMN